MKRFSKERSIQKGKLSNEPPCIYNTARDIIKHDDPQKPNVSLPLLSILTQKSIYTCY